MLSRSVSVVRARFFLCSGRGVIAGAVGVGVTAVGATADASSVVVVVVAVAVSDCRWSSCSS